MDLLIFVVRFCYAVVVDLLDRNSYWYMWSRLYSSVQHIFSFDYFHFLVWLLPFQFFLVENCLTLLSIPCIFCTVTFFRIRWRFFVTRRRRKKAMWWLSFTKLNWNCKIRLLEKCHFKKISFVQEYICLGVRFLFFYYCI